MTVQEKVWYQAQVRVRQWLKLKGINTEHASYYAPFDLYTSRGTRIEVKYAPFSVRPKPMALNGEQAAWWFNIHRHGKLDCSAVDFYILRCDGSPELETVGLNAAFHVIIKSPIEKKTLCLSLRTILRDYGSNVDAHALIEEFDRTLTPEHRSLAYTQANTANPILGTATPRPPRPPNKSEKVAALYKAGAGVSEIAAQLKEECFAGYTMTAAKIFIYGAIRRETGKGVWKAGGRGKPPKSLYASVLSS